VEFDLRGLVLGGGNAIGNADGINQVKGTLVCDAGGLNLAFDTVLVPLSARGDAEFAGVVGPIPTTCTPAMSDLIRHCGGCTS